MFLYNWIKIKLWFVVEKADLTRRPLCICLSKKQAAEYISLKCRQDHFTEYLQWCVSNQLDSNYKDNWHKFILEGNLSVESISKYSIFDAPYSLSDLAILLRAAFNYKAVGCSFEPPLE